MKVRTVIIIAVVAVLVLGGAGYGAYYLMRGQQTAVEVAPVANISMDDTWITSDDTMYGSVTSKVSQTVSLDSEHEVDEVFVREGQEVKEGDPLFSYDMTLEEIELEAEEIELQSLQLQLSKYQRDLVKYQNTPATASLETVDYELSESAGEEAPAEEVYEEPAQPEPVEAPQPVEEVVPEEPAASAEEPVEEPVQDSAGNDTGSDAETAAVEDTVSNADENVEESPDEEKETEPSETENDEDAVYRNAVLQFESLIMSIEMFLDENGNLTYDSYVVSALYNARDFFESNLANNVQEQVFTENGETYVQTSYELKAEVVHALSDAELSQLKDYVSRMFGYIAAYEAQPAEMPEETYTFDETLPEEAESETETEEAESETEETEAQIALFSTVTVVDELNDGEEVETEGISSKDYEAEKKEAIPASDRTDEGYIFEFWESSLSYVSIDDPFSATAVFKVPADDLTLTAVYVKTDSDEDTAGLSISTFIDWVDYIHDVKGYQAPDKDKLRNAIDYYLENLCLTDPLPEEITIEELLGSYYDLKLDDALSDYLESMDNDELNDLLKKLGLEDVDEADAVDKAVEKLQTMYQRLCIEYSIYLLSDQYDTINTALKNGEEIDDSEMDNFLKNLQDVYDAYNDIKDVEDIDPVLKNLLLELYDEWIDQTEPQSETESEKRDTSDGDRYDDGWYEGDYWDEGEGEEEYTAEELAEMIAELEQQIKETELSIKECELSLEQAQRLVDEKIVRSALNGTVVSIGDSDEGSDDDYFVKVTDMVGLYAKGVISELELSTVTLGDLVSGITDDGQSFTAVIKDIADYPDPNGADYSYGNGNTNATYYSFSALIDDPEGIEEGSAELTLSMALAEDRNSIWLDTYMVRTDAAGNNYVYVEGDNGELEMRYVSTGAVDSDWAIEVTGGLSRSDNIAFPYGDNVHEGAPTKEVGNLDSAYE